MPEAFVWPEASISLWTGAAVPVTSALVAYAQNINANFARGWDNHVTLGGVYYDHKTGQIAQINIGAVYTYGMGLLRMIESATALHMKLYHSSVNGSAGVVLYSGRVDSNGIAGSDSQVFSVSIAYHSNVWSAF
jgi:hypothetical protein